MKSGFSVCLRFVCTDGAADVLSLRVGSILISPPRFAPAAWHSEPDALFCDSLSCLWNKLITLMHFSRYHVDSHSLRMSGGFGGR